MVVRRWAKTILNKIQGSQSLGSDFKAPHMYGLSQETPICCGHSLSPSLADYTEKFFTSNGGLEEDITYLAKLRCPNGSMVRHLHTGQALHKNGTCARLHLIICKCNEHRSYLWIDGLRKRGVMPPDLKGWSIDPQGVLTKEDNMQDTTSHITIARIKDHILKEENQCESFNLIFDEKNSVLSITCKPDTSNPLPLHAEFRNVQNSQPVFEIFLTIDSSGTYGCEFGSVKKEGEYILKLLMPNKTSA